MWELDYTVDAFGDQTDQAVLRGTFPGTFSNTATSGSNLTAVVFFTPTGMLIRLLEYNRTKATFREEYGFEMAIKVDDTVETLGKYSISGTPPNSDLNLILNREKFAGYLNDGKDISCVINIGTSKYNFTIDATGFSELFEELMSA